MSGVRGDSSKVKGRAEAEEGGVQKARHSRLVEWTWACNTAYRATSPQGKSAFVKENTVHLKGFNLFCECLTSLLYGWRWSLEDRPTALPIAIFSRAQCRNRNADCRN